MKKYLLLISQFAVIALVALAFTACGEEVNNIPESSKPQKGKTEFAAGGKNTVNSNGTRTTTDDDCYFYWTAGDNIFVEKTAGTWIPSETNTITTTQPTAKFYFDEALNGDRYNVRYTGYGSTSAEQVKIASAQTQKEWSNGEHIAVSGDCGLAEATPQGERKYKFTLKHQAAYIILYPYMVSSIPTHYPLNRTYTLMKIEVKSTGGAEIAGTYNFSETGITGAATANASDIITLNCGTNGFALENNSNPSKHYAVIVMRPIQNNKLTFTYYIKDNTDGTIFTYSDSPGIRTYSANGFTILTQPMPDMVFNMPTYYKWGASVAYVANGNEWENTLQAPVERIGGVWDDTPNVNELCWYASTAIPNINLRWRIAGQSTVYTCGIWMKKLRQIATENRKTLAQLAAADPNGIDWRTKANINMVQQSAGDFYRVDNPGTGSPVPAIINNYFYLPCFGLYHYTAPNVLTSFGYTAYYWGKSAGNATSNIQNAPRFGASSATVNVNLQDRRHGEVAGQGWFQ